jgi:hypothetical protein
MVGLWPCKESTEIHINGRRVSEPVQKDKGKETVSESEDEKDPARAADRGEELGNLSRVHREYDTDRWTDRVTRDSQGNRDGYSGR